jgi:hypothetical protein
MDVERLVGDPPTHSVEGKVGVWRVKEGGRVRTIRADARSVAIIARLRIRLAGPLSRLRDR